jgi:hypothetical protein
MGGRTTSFHYDAKKHNDTIHPHHDDGVTIKSCDKNSVVLHVGGVAVDKSKAWVPGWLFTATEELGCPHPETGAPSVAYRRVTGVTREAGGKITLATEKAEFHHFFNTLKLRMFSNMLLHNNSDSGDASADAAGSATTASKPGARRLLGRREGRELWGGVKHVAKKVVHAAKKVVKKVVKVAKKVYKKVIAPVVKVIKTLVTGSAKK